MKCVISSFIKIFISLTSYHSENILKKYVFHRPSILTNQKQSFSSYAYSDAFNDAHFDLRMISMSLIIVNSFVKSPIRGRPACGLISSVRRSVSRPGHISYKGRPNSL